MGVRAAHAGGHHAGSPGTLADPFLQARVHIEWRAGKIDFGIGLREVETRRELSVLKSQDRLDDAGDRRGGVEVSHIGLDRPEGTVARALRGGTERFGQGPDLDGIPDGRPRTVRLDVADAVSLDAGIGQRLDHGFRLAVDARRRVARLGRTVIVDGRSPDHGVNDVAVGEGVRQPLQHEDAAAAPEHRAVGLGVKRPDVPVRRNHAATITEVTGAVRDPHRPGPCPSLHSGGSGGPGGRRPSRSSTPSEP